MYDAVQGQSIVSGDGDDPRGGEGSAGLGPREFKALEGLSPVEARLLVTSLVEDATAAGIGEMLQREEASKQVIIRVFIFLRVGYSTVFFKARRLCVCVCVCVCIRGLLTKRGCTGCVPVL